MSVKAFQCSTCANLQLADGKCMCHAAQPVPKYRDKSDKELCLAAYTPLLPNEQWHEKFYWE